MREFSARVILSPAAVGSNRSRGAGKRLSKLELGTLNYEFFGKLFMSITNRYFTSLLSMRS